MAKRKGLPLQPSESLPPQRRPHSTPWPGPNGGPRTWGEQWPGPDPWHGHRQKQIGNRQQAIIIHHRFYKNKSKSRIWVVEKKIVPGSPRTFGKQEITNNNDKHEVHKCIQVLKNSSRILKGQCVKKDICCQLTLNISYLLCDALVYERIYFRYVFIIIYQIGYSIGGIY